ncbi:MAG: hypothetical protein V3V00_02710 [Saprospiraceae bacterium]
MNLSQVYKNLFFYWLLFLLLCSCAHDNIVRTEVIQVYSVIGSTEGFVAGDLIYQDSVSFQNAHFPHTKYVFDKNKNIMGYEVYPILKNNTTLQSSYHSSDGIVLSYYKYELNKNSQKKRVEAFDANNDDLLRYEEMEYNGKNLLLTRKIFTSEGQMATSYSFIYDGYGNEMQKITQHLIRDTIITEESRITKYNDDKSWKEKWGFVNNKPVAFYKKVVTSNQ